MLLYIAVAERILLEDGKAAHRVPLEVHALSASKAYWRDAGDYTAAPSPKGSSGISGGAIAGIVIGVLAGLAILALLSFFILRRRRRRSSSLPIVTTDAKASKGYEGGGEEQVDGLGALPQLPTSLQPGTNPFLPSMLSWKPDEGVVKATEDPAFPAIRSLRGVGLPPHAFLCSHLQAAQRKASLA